MLSRDKIKVIDLFCGVGGLTHGFIRTGFDVIAGIDNDKDCRYGYEVNNKTKFIAKDIADVSANEIEQIYGKDTNIRVLIGCAPCQPFSKLNNKDITLKQLQPIEKFAKLIEQVKPDIVSMENVRGLLKDPIFKKFLDVLDKNKYAYEYKVVNFSDYGVPQNRYRIVMLASRLGKISLISPTHKNNKRTVRDTISKLESIKDGEISKNDLLHRARLLSALNKKRIKATPKDGGNSRSWDRKLVLKCHKKKSGETYRGSVYGRMKWDAPAPTMTTQCTGIGNGRYGHPEEDRAISLREASLFQTFPKSYQFIDPKDKFTVTKVARFIGNAVPVRAGEIIARSIEKHIFEYSKITKVAL